MAICAVNNRCEFGEDLVGELEESMGVYKKEEYTPGQFPRVDEPADKCDCPYPPYRPPYPLPFYFM